MHKLISSYTSSLIELVGSLESQLDNRSIEIATLKSRLSSSVSSAEMYRDNCIEWKKSTEQLQDLLATMVVNIGRPISKEIKKYQSNM